MALAERLNPSGRKEPAQAKTGIEVARDHWRCEQRLREDIVDIGELLARLVVFADLVAGEPG